MFLSWKKIISLEEAAAKLTPPSSDQNKIKTRIRRLYDIANVFKSIGIIRKTHIDSKNKPGFEYLGFQGLETFLKDFYPKNELLQEQGVSIKKQTTIITQNSANLSNNSVLEEEDENRPPKFETNAKNNNFIMSYSNFKKIKRTNQSPFKPLSSSIENNKKISPKIGKHLIL